MARKNKGNPKNWKQSIRKQKRNSGESYTSSDGKERPARHIKPSCPDKCKLKCSLNIPVDQREKIFELFYKTASYERQRDFILQNVKAAPSGKKAQGKRVNRVYYLPVEDKKMQVCQLFFLNTISIGQKMVTYTLRKKKDVVFCKPDKRGKHKSVRKAKEVDLDAVRAHIKKFPVMPSHYCRATTKRKYLSPNLSVAKMYDLYVEECLKPLSLKQYRHVFNTEFNLGLHVPKKDACKNCSCYTNASSELKKKLETEHQKHLKNKETARNEKDQDKSKAAIDPSFRSFTFDLQQVLSTPSSNTSVLFYKRKLSSYNFTVYNQQLIKYRYGFDEEFHVLRVSASGRRKGREVSLESLYSARILISAAKRADLINLCDTHVIPELFHSYYRGLPSKTTESDDNSDDDNGSMHIPED